MHLFSKRILVMTRMHNATKDGAGRVMVRGRVRKRRRGALAGKAAGSSGSRQ
jgi:hypothetical protein